LWWRKGSLAGHGWGPELLTLHEATLPMMGPKKLWESVKYVGGAKTRPFASCGLHT
jgi:hypothetical protein